MNGDLRSSQTRRSPSECLYTSQARAGSCADTLDKPNPWDSWAGRCKLSPHDALTNSTRWRRRRIWRTSCLTGSLHPVCSRYRAEGRPKVRRRHIKERYGTDLVVLLLLSPCLGVCCCVALDGHGPRHLWLGPLAFDRAWSRSNTFGNCWE